MISTKKVTLVVSSLGGGGAEAICVNIANHLSESGWQVDLIVLNLKKEVHFEFISKKINLVILSVDQARYSFFPLIRYFFKKKVKTCLVFSHEMAVVIIILRIIFRLDIKIISRNISILSIKINELKNKGIWKKFFVRFLINFFYHKIDHVVNQCHNMRIDLIKVFPKLQDRSSVIYNPLSTEISDYISKNDLTKIKKKNYLLCIGRLDEVKAFHYALKAFASIVNDFPTLRLKIVGTGNLDYDLKQKAIEYGIVSKVDFEGFQKNTIPYYLYAKATILTSLYEGYPNVLLESISLNTPIVAFDSPGGISEIVKDGINGYLVKYKNVDDLRNKISMILSNKFEYLSLKNSIKKNENKKIYEKYEGLIA